MSSRLPISLGLIIIAALMALSVSAPLAYAQATTHKIAADFSVLFGYGSSLMNSDPSKTSVGTTTLGFSLAVPIKQKFLIGFASDYHFITQFSNLDPVIGNRRGAYINYVGPMIGFRSPHFALKVVGHFVGAYSLENLTAVGQTIKYRSPVGVRVEAVILLKQRFKPVLFFETIGFGTQAVDGATGTLTNKLNLMQGGIGATIMY